jgi:acetylornithine aminotransferase
VTFFTGAFHCWQKPLHCFFAKAAKIAFLSCLFLLEERMRQFLMQTYARQAVTFVKGEGVWLYDDQGQRYLDALSGIAVCGLGHAHPAVTRALCEQAATLIHTSNLYHLPWQEKLAAKLCEISGMDRVFFANSGAEANEAAIKLARLLGHQRGIAVPKIIVMEQSFHGRTLAALSATGNVKAQTGFAPLVEGFIRIPYNDLAAAEALAGHPDIVAVLVEPIQGEGGIRVGSRDYLQGLQNLCQRQHWLLMVDEIQAGMGRTGYWFGHQHDHLQPDVMTLAKGLANGVPIGACLARGQAAELFAPGNHGSTFGGNPLATRAALAVIETMEQEHLLMQAARMGQWLQAAFRERLGQLPGVLDIRGRGLMLGIVLDRPCGELVAQALAEKLLINVTAGQVIRLLPPLILQPAEAEIVVARLGRLVENFLEVTTTV